MDFIIELEINVFQTINYIHDRTLTMCIFLRVYNIHSREQCLTWNINLVQICVHMKYTLPLSEFFKQAITQRNKNKRKHF